MEQSIEIRRTDWRDFPLAHYLTLNPALLMLGLMVLLAVVSRFWDLGSRALHHDESLHALYSYYLYDRGEYQHNPLMHGPLLFHLTALGYWLFGVSDATARLVPAILGVFLVWVPWKFRDWLGVKGALFASLLVLVSPTLLYYSRFIREDIFAAAWTVIIVYATWKYLEDGEDFHLYLTAAGWALLFSQKELSFLLAFVFWVFLALVALLRFLGRLGPKPQIKETREWHLLVMIGALLLPHASALVLHLLNMDPTGGYNDAAYQSTAFLTNAGAVTLFLFLAGYAAAIVLWNPRKFLIAAGIFYAIFVLLHTTFLTWPWGIGSGLVGALGYWIEQHGVERGGQPWFYYAMLLPLYEFLPLLVGLVGGGILLARRRNGAVAPGPRDGNEPLDTRALWPWFNLWWFLGSFLLLSYAGEKMPWLLVHIALPVIFLAGWAMDKFLERVDTARLRSARSLAFALLFTVLLIATLSILWMALVAQWPLRGTDQESLAISTRWLLSLLFLGGAAYGLVRSREHVGRESAGQVAILTLTALMALASVRFAVIASFRNGDVPNEPLIYTQTSPDVPMVMQEIETISEQTAGGKNLAIAYDSSVLWPFEWYLRDYPNKFYYAENPSGFADSVRGASVVLAGLDQENLVKPLVPGYIRHHYSMRPNFPEDYKNLLRAPVAEADPNDPAQVRFSYGEEQPRNVLNVVSNLWRLAGQPQARAEFLDFLVNRRVANELGRYDFVVYVKPEVASEVWQYGLTVATLDPSLTRDPYADVTVQLPATTIVGQAGEFLSPKNVAVLPDGNLAVADSGNHRIRVMQLDGTLVSEFGSFGTGEGQFNEPWGVAAAPDGTLYVADTWNHRIQHLTIEGEVLHVWGTFAETGGVLGDGGTFWGPRDVAVDSKGNVYVTDTGNKRVQKFDAEGNFLDQFGGSGAEAGQFAEPVGVAVSPDGTIWVADTWNRRVQGFSPDFTPLVQFPVRAWSGQSITNKPYIAASDGRVWITDPEGYRVVEFDTSGEVQRVWGQFGSEANGLNLPLGLAWDEESDSLWVADSENHRVLGYPLEP